MLATLLMGVLVAGLMMPYALGLGQLSNRATEAIKNTGVDNLDKPPPYRSTMVDSEGNVLAYFYEQNRIPVPLADMSNLLVKGLLAVEDRRFFSHRGVDWVGTLRSAVLSAAAGTVVGGGSTLTQQYVKNFNYLVVAETASQKQAAVASSPLRKLKEAKQALMLENKTQSKEKILELYLNLVAFGPNVYGAEAAAQYFFGIPARQLEVQQAALLVAMINNPNRYNPFRPDRQEETTNKRNIVLDVMARQKVITAKAAEEAKALPLGVSAHPLPNGCLAAPNSVDNGYFCQYVLDYLEKAGITEKVLNRGGFTIKTTMDPKAMAAAKASVKANADPSVAEVNRIADVIAIVEPSPSTRKIPALVANRPFGLNQKQGETVQRLTTTFAPLGAGSTFKVFTAAAALEAGLGAQTVIDVPAEYRSPAVPSHVFRNAGRYPPSLTLTEALASSPNTSFVALEDQVGLGKVAEMSVRLGLKGYELDASDVDRAFAGSGTSYLNKVTQERMVSFTLGVSPVSPIELANVGGTIASDGIWCPPTPVNSIQDINGKLVDWKQQPCQKAIEPGLARTLAQSMRGDVNTDIGTSHAAASAAGWTRTAAGKTGTTQDYKSSAFLGFTPQYAASVMVWDYLPRPEPICRNPLRSCKAEEAQGGAGMSGGSVPAHTWFDAMKPLHEGLPEQNFPPADVNYLQGQQAAQVPNVVGMDVEQAKTLLEQGGFKVTSAPNSTSGARANVVVDQSPKQTALPGSTITIQVATGGAG